VGEARVLNSRITKWIGVAILCTPLLSEAQFLAVDRSLPASGAAGATKLRPAASKSPVFLADHFTVGRKGEVWFIDAIRVWSDADWNGGRQRAMGDAFENIVLFGGIEAPPPEPGVPECDCHNLVALRNAPLRPGSDAAGAGVRVTAVNPELRQIDFPGLNWSVPGGVDIQFGVMGVARPGSASGAVLSLRAARGDVEHQIRIFDSKGKFVALYRPEDDAAGKETGFNVQVWAHKSASISIRSVAGPVEVAIRGDANFDLDRVDPATLRFGPGHAAPASFQRRKPAEGGEMVVKFRLADTGIRPGDVNACLQGLQTDGVPFEGCDLLHH
jgi:hypothetical protein